jgi:hypothetical protein
VKGTVELDGKPVRGAVVQVDAFRLPAATGPNGGFTYLADGTAVARHVVSVVDVSQAKVGGRPLTTAEQTALKAARGAITVAYVVNNLKIAKNGSGQPVITGTLNDGAGKTPPAVEIYSHELSGTVTDSSGKPVVGAVVSTRTVDRDYWTESEATDSKGYYTSLFPASAEASGKLVPFTVRVAVGDVVYQFLPAEYVYFKRLQSAVMNLQLPPDGYAMALPLPTTKPGAVYTGMTVGVQENGRNIRPVSTTWPDKDGNFKIVLPASSAGKQVSIWEGVQNLYQVAPAKAGGDVELTEWPLVVPPSFPQDLATGKA